MGKASGITRGGCLLMMIILAVALLTLGFGIWMLVEEPKPTPVQPTAVQPVDANFHPAHPAREPA